MENGFKYAFENGNDFIFVRIYDFQGVRNVNIAMNVLNSDLDDGNKNKTNHLIIVDRIR